MAHQANHEENFNDKFQWNKSKVKTFTKTIVVRASGFVKVYQLRGTKTKHVISCLQEFVEAYCSPPYWITSNGGPQFATANQAIKSWCEASSIAHKLSSANNPEGNGEAKQAVQ